MFVKIDKSVKVVYEPFALQENSWGYNLTIENIGKSRLMMKSNYWQIPNLDGEFERIDEDNVKDVELCPGDTCEIIGHPPLFEKDVMVIGTYTLKDENGEEFDLHVPFFNPYLPVSKTFH
ncbi:MAG: hypothetical protein H6850_02670 [Alphaproteobacteria bacterium]|nr:MAG: hypothetical protein H6850_02670 [Alphaproteobacteria bacterium]